MDPKIPDFTYREHKHDSIMEFLMNVCHKELLCFKNYVEAYNLFYDIELTSNVKFTDVYPMDAPVNFRAAIMGAIRFKLAEFLRVDSETPEFKGYVDYIDHHVKYLLSEFSK